MPHLLWVICSCRRAPALLLVCQGEGLLACLMWRLSQHLSAQSAPPLPVPQLHLMPSCLCPQLGRSLHSQPASWQLTQATACGRSTKLGCIVTTMLSWGMSLTLAMVPLLTTSSCQSGQQPKTLLHQQQQQQQRGCRLLRWNSYQACHLGGCQVARLTSCHLPHHPSCQLMWKASCSAARLGSCQAVRLTSFCPVPLTKCLVPQPASSQAPHLGS